MKIDPDILTNLQTALAICQCAEDSSTEEHIKRALAFVNGTLLTVRISLARASDIP